MRMLVTVIVVLGVSTPALAQGTNTLTGQPNAAINPGQLDFGSSGAGSPAGALTPPSSNGSITNPGQLDVSRTGGTGGGPSGTGAGISTGATTIPGSGEDYTQPIYGRSLR